MADETIITSFLKVISNNLIVTSNDSIRTLDGPVSGLYTLKKPIMSIGWLCQCWIEHRVVPQKSLTSVLPFVGLTICVTEYACWSGYFPFRNFSSAMMLASAPREEQKLLLFQRNLTGCSPTVIESQKLLLLRRHIFPDITQNEVVASSCS
ncbi:hypothetical protein HPP92_002159 [Vanilla planifolia]|uniref:Uncharacterized protein n=1 Tax=Vanilla planifolia TaxID=51239 RepID=A0A835VHM9_VANPL|nr:hypothetical protein HPP92_002159 [Vanilla planifolia]